MNFYAILLFIFILLAIPIHAETIIFNINSNANNDFTRQYKLEYKNEQFELSTIKIKPLISIKNKEYNLSYINKSIFIKDNLYNYEFGYIINNVALNDIDYVEFEINAKKYDEISYTDGKFRIIFNDLENKGNLQLLDNKIILYNPTSSLIHPTIELLPNSTNKAYSSVTLIPPPTPTPFNATTEFTSTEYNSTNASDNNRYIVQISSTISKTRYKEQRYTFNLSNIGITNINWMRYCIEGYFTAVIGSFDLYYYNVSSSSWIFDTYLPDTIEGTICKNFTSNAQSTSVYNSTNKLFQVGMDCYAEPDIENRISTTTFCYTDFVNLTINYNVTEQPPITKSKCEYFCYPFKEVDNKQEMEILHRQNLILENRYFIENLQNEEIENDCKIFWYNKDLKDKNFCINLYSKKTIILSEINENTTGFIGWLVSIFNNILS